ncbi:hypothetical protein DTO212C5_1539 [Paecilomyces variotii]|nr:hypothetical protein DTO212C5_1539 [Paecilomyces variotii]
MYTNDFDECIRTIEGLTEFDADERVWVLMAHDDSVLPILSGEEDKDIGWFFPHRTLNGWRQAGLAKRGMWRFLSDFEQAIDEN